MDLKRWLVTLTAITLVTGCGFRLKGSYELPESLSQVSVTSQDPQGELSKILKRQLSLRNSEVINTASAMTPQVRLFKDKLDRRTLSLFPNGQVAEYELIYTVTFQIQMPKQDAQEFSFELFRDYKDDPNAVLAKSREMSLIIKEFRELASDKIMQQLAQL